MEAMERYRRSQDEFDAMVGAVPTDRWDWRSACARWTVRDVVGHVVWGQEQLQHWATGQPYDNRGGAPGAPRRAAVAGSDPVATWRAARAASLEVLTEEALTRTVVIPGLGKRSVEAIVTLLTTDLLAHAWDIGHG